jgi:hypothetical protein
MQVPEFVPMFLRTSIIKYACSNKRKIGEEVFQSFFKAIESNPVVQAMHQKSLNIQHDYAYCRTVHGIDLSQAAPASPQPKK